VEDIPDSMQSSTAMSCSSTVEDSLVLFEVMPNSPLRYTISPRTGFLLTSKACIITVELSNSELGLVCFISTIPGNYFVSDHIVVVADVLGGSAVIDFGNVPTMEKAEAIRQHFQTHSGTFCRELSVEYHFSIEFMQMLTLFSSPAASTTTLAVSPFENLTRYHLQVDKEIEIQQLEPRVMDDAKVNNNQRELGAAFTQDTALFMDSEPLKEDGDMTCRSDAAKTSKSDIHPKSTGEKRQKTNSKFMASRDAGVNSTRTN